MLLFIVYCPEVWPYPTWCNNIKSTCAVLLISESKSRGHNIIVFQVGFQCVFLFFVLTMIISTFNTVQPPLLTDRSYVGVSLFSSRKSFLVFFLFWRKFWFWAGILNGGFGCVSGAIWTHSTSCHLWSYVVCCKTWMNLVCIQIVIYQFLG